MKNIQYDAAILQYFAGDLYTRAHSIRVPILYLQGEEDRLVRKSSFQEIQMVKPDTVLASITSPHFVLQRQPRKAADLIAHFVTNLPSSVEVNW